MKIKLIYSNFFFFFDNLTTSNVNQTISDYFKDLHLKSLQQKIKRLCNRVTLNAFKMIQAECLHMKK